MRPGLICCLQAFAHDFWKLLHYVFSRLAFVNFQRSLPFPISILASGGVRVTIPRGTINHRRSEVLPPSQGTLADHFFAPDADEYLIPDPGRLIPLLLRPGGGSCLA